MKKFFEEFKTFISRGNVLDMAIGVVIAGAFGKITTSLVNDLLMPFISWLVGARDMTALNIVIREAVMDGETVVKEGITLGFGTFVGTIIDFLLVALVIFFILRSFNRAHEKLEKLKKKEEKEAAEAVPEDLLLEIRDLLKDKNA